MERLGRHPRGGGRSRVGRDYESILGILEGGICLLAGVSYPAAMLLEDSDKRTAS